MLFLILGECGIIPLPSIYGECGEMAKRNFTDEQEAQIAKEYLAGKSTRQIAREKGLSHHISIISALRRQGVKQRSPAERNRLYQLNHNAFDVIDSERKAYFWGLLYADGGIHKRSLSLSVKKSDMVLCSRLKTFLESEHPIYELDVTSTSGNWHKQSCLYVTSKHLTSRLKQLGVKTNRPNPQQAIDQIPDHLFNHWLRGFFDGDGTAKKNRSLAFCGSNKLMWILRDKIKSTCNLKSNANPYKHSTANLWYQHYTIIPARIVAEFMYRDATIWLERKRDVIDNWIVPPPRERNKKGQFIQTVL